MKLVLKLLILSLAGRLPFSNKTISGDVLIVSVSYPYRSLSRRKKSYTNVSISHELHRTIYWDEYLLRFLMRRKIHKLAHIKTGNISLKHLMFGVKKYRTSDLFELPSWDKYFGYWAQPVEPDL